MSNFGLVPKIHLNTFYLYSQCKAEDPHYIWGFYMSIFTMKEPHHKGIKPKLHTERVLMAKI